MAHQVSFVAQTNQKPTLSLMLMKRTTPCVLTERDVYELADKVDMMTNEPVFGRRTNH
jgi:hypothetical protein